MPKKASMKILIAYYSRSGQNERLAREIEKKLDTAVIEEIADQKNRDGGWGMFWASYDAFFHKLTQIEVVQNDPKDFDLVIIASPLWAGSLPPATRVYLTMNRENIKKYAFISVSNEGKDNLKAIEDLSKTARQSPVASLLLSQEEYAPGAQKQIEEFVLNLA